MLMHFRAKSRMKTLKRLDEQFCYVCNDALAAIYGESGILEKKQKAFSKRGYSIRQLISNSVPRILKVKLFFLAKILLEQLGIT